MCQYTDAVNVFVLRVLILLNVRKQSVCMREKDWHCRAREIALAGSRRLYSTLAAAPVVLVHAVVTSNTSSIVTFMFVLLQVSFALIRGRLLHELQDHLAVGRRSQEPGQVPAHVTSLLFQAHVSTCWLCVVFGGHFSS
jgi:hypothetical protein